LKSYDIDEVLISKLIDSKKEVLFLQNGLLVQSKIKDTTQLFAIGTVTGIQSKLKGKRIDVKIQNTSIIAKLNDKTYKLNELAVGQNLPHTKLNFGSDVQTEFYKKYVRWILTGCLNLLNNKGIGDSLKQTPKGDILLAITELIIFIDYEFSLKIYADDILNTMYSLPKNLKTSSYSDFQKGKPTEILNELDYVVSILKTFNNQSLMLEKWKRDIIYEK
jgi:ketopantoate reductase